MEELVLVPSVIKEVRVFEVLLMWNVGELLVYGICNSRLVLQGKWFRLDQTVRNLTCGDADLQRAACG